MEGFRIFLLSLVALCDVTWAYKLGIGRADVTGPVAEITLMGYGKFGQKGTGLHTRQYAKAYIVNDGANSLVFVNVDVGMMADGVRLQVLRILNDKFSGLYNKNNVILSGTHTHSAPGGFMMHTFFDLPTGGFCNETFHALVSGIVKSVERAHDSLQEGRLYIATTTVLGVTVNRSPSSYRMNPLDERENYLYDTDKNMTQLQFYSVEGELLGVINWFAIHGTSLNNTNTLISSDNIGYAALALEQYVEPGSLQGRSKFTAAFASSNLGDVSPNTNLPMCHQSGTECNAHSKCADMFEECYGTGPGRDMYESVAIIGEKLAVEAWGLLKQNTAVEITGPIGGIHQYVDMPKAKATVYNEAKKRVEHIRGCTPAMGYSAGAGTTDGQFLPFLHQGMTKRTWWIDAVVNILAKPTRSEAACHAPKPILLASSHLNLPFKWQPSIVSTQLGRIGNLAIVCVPGEFTTMAGRRMRRAVEEVFGEGTIVVIAGLCNTYSDYIATFEEYQVQRYEAASTLYGPHTLALHLLQYKKLAQALIENKTLSAGPEPKGLDPNLMTTMIPPVIFDAPMRGHDFGDVLIQPSVNVSSLARATFVGAHPRNNLTLDDTYFVVEEKVADDVWKAIATDADFNTRFHWRRTNAVEGTSEVDVEWYPTHVDTSKQYRMRYFGTAKSFLGKLLPFEGVTEPFIVM